MAVFRLYLKMFDRQNAGMEYHTWKEKTEEGTIMYRAGHHAGRWLLEMAPKVGRAERDDVDWVPIEFTREHWETLRELLWKKYQRKRCPWKFIEHIDKLLADPELMAKQGEIPPPIGQEKKFARRKRKDD